MVSLVLRVWARLFQQPTDNPPAGLRRTTVDYYRREAEFSEEGMHLQLAADEARDEESDIDLVDIWRHLDTDDLTSGRIWLVKLAIRILSVIANSAGCERLFSAMGLIHTKTRNRLGLEKVRKAVYLKSTLQREQEILGWTRPRLKRKIDESSATLSAEALQAAIAYESDVLQASSVATGDVSYAIGVQKLIDEANLDCDDILDGLTTFGRPMRVPIVELFTFDTTDGSVETRKSMDMFWKGGIRNSENELALMGTLQSDILTDDVDSTSTEA